MQHNPYQPPAFDHAAPVPAGTVAFSIEGEEVVGGLAKWMRFVGTFYVIGAGLGVLAMLPAMFAGGGESAIIFLIVIPLVLIVATAGIWLRESGDQFRRGIAMNDEGTLGAGFATLRKFLIMFGIIELVSVVFALVGVVL
jgi:hypothetical protein